MYGIGIDVGSTFTKYCVLSADREIVETKIEKTPIRQETYFENKVKELLGKYGDCTIVSCGYGKDNIGKSIRKISEISALSAGANFYSPEMHYILDIGGQDTKIVFQENGKTVRFFINDKCAAGSGQFLLNTLSMLNVEFDDIDLSGCGFVITGLSSTCAVFAQSEIVEMIASNATAEDIICSVIFHIVMKSRQLIKKINPDKLYISGGLSSIKGLSLIMNRNYGIDCIAVENGVFFSSIGCALFAINNSAQLHERKD